MRRKWDAVGSVAFAAGLLVLASPAHAQSNEPSASAPPISPATAPVKAVVGFHEHDGLYIRLAVGPSVMHASWKEGANSLSVDGIGYALVMTLGWSPLPNLIVYAEITGSEIVGPTQKRNGVSTTLTDFDVGFPGIGPGVAYYLAPSNIYVSGTLAFSRLFKSYEGSQSSGPETSAYDGAILTGMGIGGTLMLGKEWWVSANWGLGMAAVVHLASMKVTNYDSRASAEALSLVLSATYN